MSGYANRGVNAVMQGPRLLLINPPLWNAYAPHLAVPILAASAARAGWGVKSLDLSIESADWLTSRVGLEALWEKLEQRARGGSVQDRREIDRAMLVFEVVAEQVDASKAVMRSLDGLAQGVEYERARLMVRNALWCVSAAFPGLEFDLLANDSTLYSTRSSQSVLQAVSDPDSNVYRWVFEDLLGPQIADPEIGVVGLSVSADTQLVAAMTAARMIRDARPDVHIVMGGNYVTRIATRWTSRHPFFDLVDSFVLGEGEEALPALLERLFVGDRRAVPGLMECDGDMLRSTPTEPVALNEIPVPDFSDLPLEKYFAPARILPLYASRSCGFDCAFCSIPFASNKFRIRSAERVVDDMDLLSERHDTPYFMFIDEILTPASLKQVSNELLDRQRDYRWYGETRFGRHWSRDLARTLYRSGCRRLNFGLESYNQRVLDLMRKRTQVPDIARNVEDLLAAGLPIHLFAILGFPGERESESLNTIRFVKETMERSRLVHGVPYTTWGASEFILDLHCDVGLHPERYGVEIVPPEADEDLALSVEYRVKDGTSGAQAAELTWSVSRDGPQSDASLDLTEFHHWKRVASEEESFLRACRSLPLPSRPDRRPRVLLGDLRLRRVWKADDVSCGVLSDVAEGGAYKAAGDLRIDLSTPVWSWLRSASEPQAARDVIQLLVAAGSERREASAALERLARYEFIECEEGVSSIDHLDLRTLVFEAEGHVVETNSEWAGRSELSNYMNGMTVRLDGLGAAVWELLQDRVCIAELEEDPDFKDTELTALSDILNALLSAGMIFARLPQLESLPRNPETPSDDRAAF